MLMQIVGQEWWKGGKCNKEDVEVVDDNFLGHQIDGVIEQRYDRVKVLGIVFF